VIDNIHQSTAARMPALHTGLYFINIARVTKTPAIYRYSAL